MHRFAALALLLLSIAASALAQAPAALPTQRIRGDVVALDGLNLQARSRSGEMVTIKLAEAYTVTGVVKIDIERIAPGAFVGIASMPQPDGTQTALEVLLFPEARRGSNEGHYPWDLQPGSMMTNATVADVVGGNNGRRLTLKYKDGEKVVFVPIEAPIVTFEPGDRAMLKPGAHIIVTATKQPDGSLTAGGVAVGKNGLVPPM
ncbi:MAG TPA: hypothetical protein VEN29_15305 [Casimicrobiaceae bacterium]|nr:hypothetical protein [Casimicrobiaceae bacterium]